MVSCVKRRVHVLLFPFLLSPTAQQYKKPETKKYPKSTCTEISIATLQILQKGKRTICKYSFMSASWALKKLSLPLVPVAQFICHMTWEQKLHFSGLVLHNLWTTLSERVGSSWLKTESYSRMIANKTREPNHFFMCAEFRLAEELWAWIPDIFVFLDNWGQKSSPLFCCVRLWFSSVLHKLFLLELG